ncbi:nuclear inhibitor of protein phosphatase 1 [Euwallacea similis]|uniref:nuclear inhibitor of protein phosphatase 1 n=1 Tax=Euwallacea similis TaxID=1736056 RepID=UPI00344CE64B
MANHYEVPNWAGKPPVGLHLDVLKGEKLIQKLMIDQKKCYLFGRNSQMNDFCIDHASCSRVHSALVWHKHLDRAFLIDLGSTHGTFIGSLRLEGYKPTQLPIDSCFHFGASTRNYIIRERPHTSIRPIIDEIEKAGKETEGGLLGLPESETELDNLTEFNTAHNRRISMLGISDDIEKRNKSRKRKRNNVSFNEDEEIINPEDIDPSIGKFRNLVQTTIVPSASKRTKLGDVLGVSHHVEFKVPKVLHHPQHDLYNDLPPETNNASISNINNIYSSLSSRLGVSLPNPAPDVNIGLNTAPPMAPPTVQVPDSMEPKKKKYAKEAWPGKKPIQTLLV